MAALDARRCSLQNPSDDLAMAVALSDAFGPWQPQVQWQLHNAMLWSLATTGANRSFVDMSQPPSSPPRQMTESITSGRMPQWRQQHLVRRVGCAKVVVQLLKCIVETEAAIAMRTTVSLTRCNDQMHVTIARNLTV